MVTDINPDKIADIIVECAEAHILPRYKMLATDDPERFAANASKFFDQGLVAADIELIDVTAAS